MFYECGQLNNYVYVYDSDDNTCELVKKKRLKDSGIVLSNECIMNSFDIARLRMMYPFESDIVSLYYDAFSYKVEFKNREIILIDVSFRIFDRLKILKVYNGVGDILESLCFGNSNKFLFLEIHQADTFQEPIESELPFRCIRRISDIIGYPVPPQMFTYIMNLVKIHDFDSIDRAMCGSLFKNLVIRSYNGYSGAKKISAFGWCKEWVYVL